MKKVLKELFAMKCLVLLEIQLNSRKCGKQFLFRVEKEEDYTCMRIRQSQINFASNPFVSWIFKSPDKQEHRGTLFRMICVGMESIWVSGNDHRVYCNYG